MSQINSKSSKKLIFLTLLGKSDQVLEHNRAVFRFLIDYNLQLVRPILPAFQFLVKMDIWWIRSTQNQARSWFLILLVRPDQVLEHDSAVFRFSTDFNLQLIRTILPAFHFLFFLSVIGFHKTGCALW